jgi:hypothetical protein
MERANPTMSITKHPKSWKDPVHFTARDNHVSLTQHCKVGSCLRAVIGRLEYLAAKNPQRCVFETFDEFVKGCNAAQRKAANRFAAKHKNAQRKNPFKEYSAGMYEHMLAFCRELGIIPDLKRRVRVLVNFDGCDRAPGWREGWVVAPHDFLTHKHHGACHFVGFGNSPDFPFKPKWGPNLWVPGYGGIQIISEGDLKARLRSDEGQIEVGLRSLEGGLEGGNEGGELLELPGNTEDTQNQSALLPAPLDGSLESVSKLGMVRMGGMVGIQNRSDHLNDEAISKPLPQTGSSSLSTGLTDSLKPNAQPSASREASTADIVETVSPGVTVQEYFANALGNADILRLMTDNVFELENNSWKLFKHKENFLAACREAIRAKSTVKLNGRLTLAMLMGEVISILDRQPVEHRVIKEKATKYPTSWLKIKATMHEGGPLHEVPGYVKTFGYTGTSRYYSNPFAHGWLHEVFHEAVVENKIDLAPWEARFVLFKNADATYREGWKFIHTLTLALKEAPPELVTVRDWLWQRDATSDKPKDPPWKA